MSQWTALYLHHRHKYANVHDNSGVEGGRDADKGAKQVMLRQLKEMKKRKAAAASGEEIDDGSSSISSSSSSSGNFDNYYINIEIA